MRQNVNNIIYYYHIIILRYLQKSEKLYQRGYNFLMLTD